VLLAALVDEAPEGTAVTQREASLVRDTDRSDLVSPDLRAAEVAIDAHHHANPLVRRPFAVAAWHFLAFCEELVVREIVRSDRDGGELTPHDYAAFADTLITHAKWPLRWLDRACRQGGSIPRSFDDGAYDAAWKLSDLGMNYLAFESAFTSATLGLITLSIEGHRITASSEMKADTRYEAYDRLTQPKSAPRSPDAREFLEGVSASVRVKGGWFYYDLDSRTIARGLELFRSTVEARFSLPGGWQLPGFSLAAIRAASSVLFLLAFVHFHARVVAARRGCLGLGYSRALLVFTRTELLRTLQEHAGISRDTAAAITETLTYGLRGQVNPDPALQPLIRLAPATYAIAPNLLVNNALERNLSVLLNRLPEERVAYTRLSQEREKISRDRLIAAIVSSDLRYWSGHVPRWRGLSEIDLAIISDDEKYCLILELKSFVAPAESREMRDRSEEIRRGIEQIRGRRGMVAQLGEPLREVLRIDESYQICWAVASETSIGAAYVQVPDVAVVQTGHLLKKLAKVRRLADCCSWLDVGAHLPREGVHYRVVDTVASVGDWTLDWYGIKGLVDNYV
jgi:hypothetical protein